MTRAHDLRIRVMRPDEIALAADWAAAEGWNPGLADAACFATVDPGGFLIGAQREFCRTWPNQDIVTIEGCHFLQEEAPEAMAQAIARFVAKVLASPQLSN